MQLRKIPTRVLFSGLPCRGRIQLIVPKRLPTFTNIKARGLIVVKPIPTMLANIIPKTRDNQS